jgi:CarD family transcriptional regulator
MEGAKYMYQIGDFVVKANHGVCRIEDVVHLNMSGVDAKKEFYYLVPLEDRGAKIYVSVDKADQDLRYAVSKEEAWELIHRIPEIESAWISNEKLREQEYKAALKSCELEKLVSIIKNMYVRRTARMAEGKRSTAIDERYFRLAENTLYSELAFALGYHKEEMQQLIFDEIEK